MLNGFRTSEYDFYSIMDFHMMMLYESVRNVQPYFNITIFTIIIQPSDTF